MPLLRILLAGMLLVAGHANASSSDDDDWQLFGRVLSLVQSVVQSAARSDDPRALEKGVDRLLSGEHREANRLAADLIGEAFEDMPAQYKGATVALAKDLATIARKERARQAPVQQGSAQVPMEAPAQAIAPSAGTDTALQARKDLTGMGLRYFDSAQFLDAVKREDALAVELYVTGRGVDLSARDADGLTALDLARRRNNTRMAELLAPARR